MASENYVNLYKDEEMIRLTVLTNICRMMVRRGYMDTEKYLTDGTSKHSTVVAQVSKNDTIDNSKFIPFIKKRNDNNIYRIELDNPYEDQRVTDKEKDVEFDGSVVVVKIIPQIVKDVSNSPLLNDFLKSHPQYHKIIVFDAMADKVYNALSRKRNVEVFDRNSLMIDMMSHVCAPIACDIVTDEEIGHITNPKISKICENDPLARYYNAKKGQILRILRTSLNNGEEIGLRKVGDPKSVFK